MTIHHGCEPKPKHPLNIAVAMEWSIRNCPCKGEGCPLRTHIADLERTVHHMQDCGMMDGEEKKLR